MISMARVRLFILSFLTSTAMYGVGLSFSGYSLPPVAITPDKSTGLDALYVLDSTEGVVATYSATSSANAVRWYAFGSSGGAYARELPSSSSGSRSSIVLGAEDCGLIVEEENRRYYFWIVNYANRPCDLRDAYVRPDESDCQSVRLEVEGSAKRITYYTITGTPKELDREISVSYNTLVYDQDKETYIGERTGETVAAIEGSLRVYAPLCDTSFRIDGDRFLRQWGREQQIETPIWHTTAIAVETSARQAERDADNESSSSSAGGLGGSAPVDITFTAAVTDAVVFTEWQFSATPDFDVIDLRFNRTDLDYTFRDYGTTYVRFMSANDSGVCEAFGPTYEVSVGESKLLCPNAFSPGSSEGVNDEWKVSYKSIIEFECHIFNRWGTKMITLTDPSQGWDGKYNGKLVPAGVYYYVIKARGADGKDYKLSGDINIVGTRRNNNYLQSENP